MAISTGKQKVTKKKILFVLNGLKTLFLFIPNKTMMPRWLEIGYGIAAWIGVVMMGLCWVKILKFM